MVKNIENFHEKFPSSEFFANMWYRLICILPRLFCILVVSVFFICFLFMLWKSSFFFFYVIPVLEFFNVSYTLVSAILIKQKSKMTFLYLCCICLNLSFLIALYNMIVNELHDNGIYIQNWRRHRGYILGGSLHVWFPRRSIVGSLLIISGLWFCAVWLLFSSL